MSVEVLVVLGVAVAIAALVQGTSGLGFALIVAPVAGLLAPGILPVALLMLMIPLNVYVAWRERAAIDFRGVGWISLARIVSTPLGVWLLAVVPPDRLGPLVGVMTVLAAAASLLTPAFTPSVPALLGAGVITGLSETATGIGGPPLALVYQHETPSTLRSTVATCFLIGEVASLVLLGFQGRVGVQHLQAAGWLMPPLVAGLAVSALLHRRVSSGPMRTFVLVFAVISGIVLVVRG